MLETGAVTDVAYWDDVWARARTKRISRSDRMFGERGLFLRLVERELGDLRGARILELGAGGPNYRLLALALWAGADVTAIDYSTIGLDVLSDVFASHGAALRSIHGDFFADDLGGARFDVVVHWGVLEHFVDPRFLLATSAARLMPGGRVLFTMPNMRAFAAELWRRYCPDNWSKHVLHTDASISAACAASELQLSRTFHTGAPLLLMKDFERGSARVGHLLAQGQRLLAWSTPLLPRHSWENRWFAAERGFVAIRV